MTSENKRVLKGVPAQFIFIFIADQKLLMNSLNLASKQSQAYQYIRNYWEDGR